MGELSGRLLDEWGNDDSCLPVKQANEVAVGPLASEDRPRGKQARNCRNINVVDLIVIRVRLFHILLLEDVQVFHDEPNFLHPLLPLDHSSPQYGHP
jgi:hypothetical protein